MCDLPKRGEATFLCHVTYLPQKAGRSPEQVHILEIVGFTSKAPSSQKNPVHMVQCPDVADFLGLVGTHQSRHVLDHVLACAGYSKIPVYGLYLPERSLGEIRLKASHVFRSDHDSFCARASPPSCGPTRQNFGTRTITSQRTPRTRSITNSWLRLQGS